MWRRYRKHFSLPSDWASDGGATFVHFEGVFHHATVFLNGHYLMSHECGYTGFDVRLDNATNVRFGDSQDNANVLTVRADASFGSGHWYEGGGIYRPVQLVHLGSTHIVTDGLFVPSESDGTRVSVSAELEATAAGGEATVSVTFELLDADGEHVASATSTSVTVPRPGSGTVTASAVIEPSSPLQLWTTKSPTTYRVVATVVGGGGVALDAVGVTVGFRTTSFTGLDGRAPFRLNDAPMHFRGFSHHNSIGGLGVAIPERVDLFRVQASRALGSNIWRMSHNPYAPALYDLLDATGQMCWDENRDYGAKYGGGAYALAMHDMVKRDRNHPSVILWSFCNEAECSQYDVAYSGLAFRAAAKGVDPTRPVTANGSPGQTPTPFLDVQGGSHWGNQSFVKEHAANDSIALVLSECCSCTSQRPDRDLSSCIGDQNSPGLISYVTGSLGVWTLMDYFGEPAGTGTSGWPHVSCDFGQFDIAGHPKPHAYWYRANWAQGFGPAEPGRPAIPFQPVARILGLPSPPNVSGPAGADAASNAVSAITTAPFAEVFLDGRSLGVQPTKRNARGEYGETAWVGGESGNCSFPVPANNVQCHGLHAVHAATSPAACAAACCAAGPGCDTWQLANGNQCWVGAATEGVGKCGKPRDSLTWVGGQRASAPPSPAASWRNATLVAYSDHPAATVGGGAVVGQHSVFRAGGNSALYRLQLSLDVPSATTGTGSALVLDGRDTALVRCAVVDPSSNNALVSTATDRITWSVLSGPGRLAGTANGDATSHEWLKSPSTNAFLGLARGMFRVTQDCVSANRGNASLIDVDGARGPTRLLDDCETAPIVVEATAPGLGSSRISIPVSIHPETDGPLAVARATARNFSNGFSYLDTFVG